MLEGIDIIQEIKNAEEEARRLVSSAEEETRQAIAKAEESAALVIEQLRKQLTEEFVSAVVKAEQEAKELIERTVAEAQSTAAAIGNLPEERIRMAVELLVKRICEKWQ